MTDFSNIAPDDLNAPATVPGFVIPTEQPTTGDNAVPWSDQTAPRAAFNVPTSFRKSIQGIESGGNYAAQNKGGYLGAYQFGSGALQDAGLYQPTDGEDINSNQWKGKIVVPGYAPMTKTEFLNNPGAQDRAFSLHMAHLADAAHGVGLDQFYGTTVAGVPINSDTVAGMAHFGGVNGVSKFLMSGGKYDPADSNGTRMSSYGSRAHGGVQVAINEPVAPPSEPPPPAPALAAPVNQTNPQADMLRKLSLINQLMRPQNQQYANPFVTPGTAGIASAGNWLSHPQSTILNNPALLNLLVRNSTS